MVLTTPSGHKFLVSKEDYDMVSRLRWVYNGRYVVNRQRYGRRQNNKVKITYLHRLIMGLKTGDGRIVDHINHNTLDNRRNNLRVCTQAENLLNKSLQRNNTSGYAGVHYNKNCKRWEASAYKNRKRIVLGHSKDFETCVKIRQNYEKGK